MNGEECRLAIGQPQHGIVGANNKNLLFNVYDKRSRIDGVDKKHILSFFQRIILRLYGTLGSNLV